MNEDELIIIVDDRDQEIGFAEKIRAHREGLKHRAFSVFIINTYDRKILLQKRAIQKYHSGGLWSNSCCSHPRRGENLRLAVLRRINQELGVEISMNGNTESSKNEMLSGKMFEAGVFSYSKQFTDLSENEIDHVFYIIINDQSPEIIINPEEVEEIRWMTLKELDRMKEESPELFTVWFFPAFNLVRMHLEKTGMINYLN